MNFSDLQQSARDLIAAQAVFGADAPATVLVDLGNVKSQTEAALQNQGYVVAIWPPVRGAANGDEAGQTPVTTDLVVRLQVNPQKLIAIAQAHSQDQAQPDPGQWVNGFITAIAAALLEADPEPGGLKWELAQDFLELMNFDEGLLAYHLRFSRLAVFGS